MKRNTTNNKVTKSMLTLVRQTVFHTNNAFTRAIYRCECGNEKEISMRKVRENTTISCGCVKSINSAHRTHGLSKHPLFNVWKGMKKRCSNKNLKEYKRYGGRGVTVCGEWLDDFKKFYDWSMLNGWRRGLELDKDIKAAEIGIDAILYSPEMCKFVTRRQNCNARKSNVVLKFMGKSQNIKQWSDELGISPSLIRIRITKLGWAVDRALSVRPSPKITGRKKLLYE